MRTLWDYSSLLVTSFADHPDYGVAAMMAKCDNCNVHFSAVSSNRRGCETLIRRKYRWHCKEYPLAHDVPTDI